MRKLPVTVVVSIATFLIAYSVNSEGNAQITATPGPIVVPTQPQAGGGSASLVVENTAVPPPTQTPVVVEAAASNLIGPETYPENVNPLTGLTVEDPALLNRRPIVHKISNAPALVRPQAGVGQADIVYEHYAEGGLTRLSAVYYGQSPQRVGSVRSARLIDTELSAMYRGILVFSGGSTGVEERIYGSVALGIDDERIATDMPVLPPSDFAERAYKGVLYGFPYYFRDESIAVPHNLFANPQAIWELATADGINTRQELRGMAFSPEIPAEEIGPASTVDVRYRATRAQWFYDAERGVYTRTSDGQPHFDATTDQQVVADNVVIIYADHYFTDIVESEWQGSRSYSIEIKVWFEGDAILVRDGRQYAARWIRPTRESMISLTRPDGTPLPFKPGQTWFQLVRLPEQAEPESEWVRIE